MKRLMVLAWAIGLGLALWLILRSGFTDLLGQFAALGWGALLVIGARIVSVAIAGLGWAALFAPRERPGTLALVWLRFVREGCNLLLPLAQIGGDVIGARLLAFRGTEGTLSAASVIVDVMIQAVTQFLFAVMGLAILVWLGADSHIVWIAAGGLVLAIPALAGFYVIQRRFGHQLATRLLTKLASDSRWLSAGTVDALFGRLRQFYEAPGRLVWSSVVHLVGWLFNAAEIWVALHVMGYPLTFAEAIVIESLGQALRGAAFIVPGGLGVQEGGIMALGALFGIPPEAGLAVALVKRVADILVGLPGLIGWQVQEGRRFFTRPPAGRLTP